MKFQIIIFSVSHADLLLLLGLSKLADDSEYERYSDNLSL